MRSHILVQALFIMMVTDDLPLASFLIDFALPATQREEATRLGWCCRHELRTSTFLKAFGIRQQRSHGNRSFLLLCCGKPRGDGLLREAVIFFSASAGASVTVT